MPRSYFKKRYPAKVREKGLPISLGAGLPVNQRSGVYDMEEFKEAAADLITQDGVSIARACKQAGLHSAVAFYEALKNRKKPLSGYSTLEKILKAIGYNVTILVHVQKIKPNTHTTKTIDPELLEAANIRQALQRKQLKRKFGRHHAQAHRLLIK